MNEGGEKKKNVNVIELELKSVESEIHALPEDIETSRRQKQEAAMSDTEDERRITRKITQKLQEIDMQTLNKNATEIVMESEPIGYEHRGERLTDEGLEIKIKRFSFTNPCAKLLSLLFIVFAVLKLIQEFNTFGIIRSVSESRRPYTAWTPVDTEAREIREECTEDDCSDYRGEKAMTKYSQFCQPWPADLIAKYPDAGLSVFDGRGNKFCRNPDGKSTIWCCYDSDEQDTCAKWAYCLPPEQIEYNENEGLIYDSSRPSLEVLQANYDTYYNDWNKTGLLGLRIQVTFKSRVNCTTVGLHFWD